MLRNTAFSLAIAAISLLALSEVMAQNTTSGAIQGRVTDPAGDPLAGVTIVVTSPALQGSQTVITDADGTFKISNLPPGTYLAIFYYGAAQVERRNILVSINRTTPVYQDINPDQAVSETIVVESRSPAVDPTSVTQGTMVDQDYARNIPVPGRTFESTLGAAAGSATERVGASFSGVTFSGSSALENQYIVEGINTTSLTYGAVGLPVLNEFIQQTEVITGGYNAEYGRSTGGVVNVVLPSGGNTFHGTIFTSVSPGFLVASPTEVSLRGSPIDAERKLAYGTDFGAQVGGPILKDRLWFSVGFAPRLSRFYIDRTIRRQTDCREADENGVLTIGENGTLSPCDLSYRDNRVDVDPRTGFPIYEEVERQRLNQDAREYQFFSKLNFAVSPEHQGQISLIGAPSSGIGPGRGTAVNVRGTPEATRVEYSGLTTDVAAKWTSKLHNNRTELETVLGWHRDSFEYGAANSAFNDMPRERLYSGNLGIWSLLGGESMAVTAACADNTPDDPFPGIINCPDPEFGYVIGGPGGLADDLEQRFSGRFAATRRIRAGGSHELKAGIDLEDNRLTKPRMYSGGAYYDAFPGSDPNRTGLVRVRRYVTLGDPGDPMRMDPQCGAPISGAGTDQAQYYTCDYLDHSDMDGETLNWSAYLRDSWQLLPNLTANLGIRYEEQRLRYAEHLQNTYDPVTERQLGKNAMELRNLWAPRAGILYDWTQEGRSKIYAYWGRFYESIPMDINDRSFGGETIFLQFFSPEQCGEAVEGYAGPRPTGCTTNYDPAAEEPAGGERYFGAGVLVAPGLKAQYLDELILGAQYEVFEDLTVEVALKNRSLGRVIEDVSTDGGKTYILANPGEWSSGEERKLEERIAAETNAANRSRLENELEMYRAIRLFDEPRRDYRALELTLRKRASAGLFLQGTYTYSRTEGNYQGLYTSDTGQIDPNITSQYDLVELLANRDGPLPQDRPHSLKLDGYFTSALGRLGRGTTGVSVRALSGIPLNALGHHYYGDDESFLLPRGTLGRTVAEVSASLHFGYHRNLGRGMALQVYIDLFNILNTQTAVARDARYTPLSSPANPIIGGEYEDLIWLKRNDESSGLETSDPVSRNPNFQNVAYRSAPFQARLGARLDF